MAVHARERFWRKYLSREETFWYDIFVCLYVCTWIVAHIDVARIAVTADWNLSGTASAFYGC